MKMSGCQDFPLDSLLPVTIIASIRAPVETDPNAYTSRKHGGGATSNSVSPPCPVCSARQAKNSLLLVYNELGGRGV